MFNNPVDQMWRADLFRLIGETPNLDWRLLTKRIGNAWVMGQQAMWAAGMAADRHNILPDTVWLGATIVDPGEADRDTPKLLEVPAKVGFLRMEPDLSKEWLAHRCGGRYPSPKLGDDQTGSATGQTTVVTDARGLSALPRLPRRSAASCNVGRGRRRKQRGDARSSQFYGLLSPASIRQASVILNVLFSWLVQAGYLAGNPLALSRQCTPKAVPRITRYLEPDLWQEVKDFIASMSRTRTVPARNITHCAIAAIHEG